MKTKTYLVLLLVSMMFGVGGMQASTPQRIIFETDMGNDVDDALGLDLLYRYQNEGRIRLLAVMLNKPGSAPVEYMDILNTFYGHPNMPIGKITHGANCENDGVNYAKSVCQMKDAAGKPLFKRSLSNYKSLIESPQLYRRILSNQADHSVTIISTGFSTNLARLLQSKSDRYSRLNGRELVARKVKRLVIMGGSFSHENPEYNILRDVPAADYVFHHWPTPLITSPFEVGEGILFPGQIITDYKGKPHPVIEGYKTYLKMPYDRPTWDITAILYAVEGGKWFGLSERGQITTQPNGRTLFTPSARGKQQYLTTTPEQAQGILKRFKALFKF